jgi:limonene-1,2-epoxide hydrolase
MLQVQRLFVAIITAGVLSMTIDSAARADTDEQKLATVKAMIHAWDTLDWDRVAALFAKDGVLRSMMTDPIVGRESIRQHLAPLAGGTSHLELQVARMGVIDGRVFVERVDDFVYNGRHGRVPVVGVFEVEGGHVKEWREYYDRAQLLSAMGVAGTATGAATGASAATGAETPPRAP